MNNHLNQILRFQILFCNISNLRKSNSITWGEKTPIHFMFIRDIIKYYPNSYFINVIRDPRDTIISIKKTKWGFLDYKERINQVKISFNLSKRYPDIKIYNIKYEDILINPKKTLKKLFDEFELNFSRNIPRKFNSSLNFNHNLEPWKLNNVEKLKVNNFNKWKKENKLINFYLIIYLSKKLNDEIIKYSYELGPRNNFIIDLLIDIIIYFRSSIYLLYKKIKEKIENKF